MARSDTVPRNAAQGDIASSVYLKLRDQLMVGDIPPGQQLVESALAESWGVSRTPIREALRKLEHDGLVVRTERGVVARPTSVEEVLDLYDVRIVLETKAAGMAAERRTSSDLLLLNKMTAEMSALDSGEIKTMVSLNAEFHRATWRASHCEPLVDLLERLGLRIGRYAQTTLSQPGRWPESNDEHAALVRAIEARDVNAAEQHAYTHFSAARNIRVQQLSGS